jgi:hypothetical protein
MMSLMASVALQAITTIKPAATHALAALGAIKGAAAFAALIASQVTAVAAVHAMRENEPPPRHLRRPFRGSRQGQI